MERREGKGKCECDKEEEINDKTERKHTVFHQECRTGWEEGRGHVCGGEDQTPPGEYEKELN